VADFMRMTQEMDRETLILSLAALNTSLQDMLPDDRMLRRDLASARLQLIQQKLGLGSDNDEIGSVIHRHIHVHLWDEGTREKVADIGRSVVGFMKGAMKAVGEFAEAERHGTMTPKEAWRDFTTGFTGMVDFMRPGGDLSKNRTPTSPQPDRSQEQAAIMAKLTGDAPTKVDRTDPADNILAERFTEAMQRVCATDEERIVVVRVVAAAMGQSLDGQLDQVREEAPAEVQSDVASDEVVRVAPVSEKPKEKEEVAAAPAKKFRFSAPQPEPDDAEEVSMGVGPDLD
jgi:hypothetical protein